mgnify:CR=1
MEYNLDISKLKNIAVEIGLSEVIGAADDLMSGCIRGRRVVDVIR